MKNLANPDLDNYVPKQSFALVYQLGVARVYRVVAYSNDPSVRQAELVYDGAFFMAECFARAMKLGGHSVRQFVGTLAGDHPDGPWNSDLTSVTFHHLFCDDL